MCGKMNIDSFLQPKKSMWKSIWNIISTVVCISSLLALIVVGVQGCMMVQYGIIYHAVSDAIRSGSK